ncbi:kinase-like protein [Auriscalpium vulgare]|uniref:Kinase-like protein n=1 Tax=Auriscalpium vulgare TaxID=40419 RepID=A0ACB8SD60_9AGAM|nr:kinase-like protein [Auriscalpium vulgare]
MSGNIGDSTPPGSDGPPLAKFAPAGYSLKLHDLELVKTLGAGSFARVVLVRTRNLEFKHPCVKPGALMAMKIIKKSVLPTEGVGNVGLLRYGEMVDNERNVLTRLPWHPFIAGHIAAFEDPLNLYHLLELLPCGNLRAHLKRYAPFDRELACFYFANVVSGLQFLHAHNIAHRDIKPENILLQQDGYVCIADFGHAAVYEVGKTVKARIGTPWYTAPEVIARARADAVDLPYTMDWWALGITLYEMVSGTLPFRVCNNGRPFDGSDPDDHNMPELFRLIETTGIVWCKEVIWYEHCIDIICGLLRKDPRHRLSATKFERSLLDHPWLANVNWKMMRTHTYDAPYLPLEPHHEHKWQTWYRPTQAEIPGLPIANVPPHKLYSDCFLPSPTYRIGT